LAALQSAATAEAAGVDATDGTAVSQFASRLSVAYSEALGASLSAALVNLRASFKLGSTNIEASLADVAFTLSASGPGFDVDELISRIPTRAEDFQDLPLPFGDLPFDMEELFARLRRVKRALSDKGEVVRMLQLLLQWRHSRDAQARFEMEVAQRTGAANLGLLAAFRDWWAEYCSGGLSILEREVAPELRAELAALELGAPVPGDGGGDKLLLLGSEIAALESWLESHPGSGGARGET
jgi:hypothetical protein